jgi:hypothetical protein
VSNSDLLTAVDDAISALVRLRSELVKREPAAPVSAAEVPAEDDLVDTWQASQLFDMPIDSVRWVARNKCFGVKRGGRWLVSASAMRRYLDRQ